MKKYLFMHIQFASNPNEMLALKKLTIANILLNLEVSYAHTNKIFFIQNCILLLSNNL